MTIIQREADERRLAALRREAFGYGSVGPGPTPLRLHLTERFWAKVNLPHYEGIPLVFADTECWLWTGPRNWGGYGFLGTTGRNEQAHRMAYRALVGPIPEGLHIDHLCRTRLCVNPAHLEAVTQHENNVRARAPRRKCRKGHAYTPENTRRDALGVQHCLTCEIETRERMRPRRREQQRAARSANRDVVNARKRLGYAKNKEKILAQQKAYYEANRERIIAQQAEYRARKRREAES